MRFDVVLLCLTNDATIRYLPQRCSRNNLADPLPSRRVSGGQCDGGRHNVGQVAKINRAMPFTRGTLRSFSAATNMLLALGVSRKHSCLHTIRHNVSSALHIL